MILFIYGTIYFSVGSRVQNHMLGLRLYPRTQIGPKIKKVNDERPPDQTP